MSAWGVLSAWGGPCLHAPQQWRIQDFTEGVANSLRRGPNPLFGIIFAENYMKMKKKIGLRQPQEKGWVSSLLPKDRPLHRSVSIDCSGGGEGAADIKA